MATALALATAALVSAVVLAPREDSAHAVGDEKLSLIVRKDDHEDAKITLSIEPGREVVTERVELRRAEAAD